MKRQNYFRMIAMFAAVFAMAFVSACSDKDEPEPEPSPEVPEEQEPEPVEPSDYSRGEIEFGSDEEALAETFTTYSMNTFRLIAEQTDADEETKNASVVYSPMGLSYVTGLLANVSDGDVRQEVLDSYSHSGLTLDVLNKFHKTVKTALPEVDRSTKIALANSVWARLVDKANVVPAFYDRMLSYDAEVGFLTDFANMDEVDKINDWVNENTFGFLPKIFENPLSVDTRLLLANTLYFNGGWNSEFDVEKTDKATFHNLDGTESEVDMMHKVFETGVSFTDKYTLLSLAYGNFAYSMIVILPRTGNSLEDCLVDIESSPEQIKRQAKGKHAIRNMVISLPKFDVSQRLNLVELMKSLGIQKAFQDSGNNLKGIFGENVGSARMNSVQQVVRIAVDEKKTEAAQVTFIDDIESYYDPIFTCDRPFMFMIAERSTGLPLFMGRVTKL